MKKEDHLMSDVTNVMIILLANYLKMIDLLDDFLTGEILFSN